MRALFGLWVIWTCEAANCTVRLHKKAPFLLMSNTVVFCLHTYDISSDDLPRDLRDVEIILHGLTLLPANMFNGLDKLERLYIYGEGSKISSLPENIFGNLGNLRNLHLVNLNLESLPANVFDPLSSLESLSLGYNMLTSLPERIFYNLSHLQELALHKNEFEGTPCALWYLSRSVTLLNLKENPFTTSLFLPDPLCTLKTGVPTTCHAGKFVNCTRQANCEWSAWTDSTTCTADCGGGSKRRSRTVEVEAQYGGGCVGNNTETTACNSHGCPVSCEWSAWDDWTNCTADCGGGSKKRSRTVEVEAQHGGECVGNDTETAACNSHSCPVNCHWSQWSAWSDHCEGDCGLATATKLRFRYFEQPPLHGGSQCVGTSVEAVHCNFPSCNATMHCEGSLLDADFTRATFKERRRNCHEQCVEKCTAEDLCGNAPIQRRKVWIDPKWTQRWFGTNLGKLMAEVALGDSFEYTSAPSQYQPCMWLLPTCANASDCDFGAPFKKPGGGHLMDSFYHWYFSKAEISARTKIFGSRQSFRVGGYAMWQEDSADPFRERCVSRCRSWCYESCSCNWGWDFPWSNEVDLGWGHRRPMRYRWIPSTQREPSYGTWKCVSPDGEPLRTPWDKPFWSMDIYSDEVKKYVNAAPLQFNLVCDHVKVYYARQVCGVTVTPCPLNCTRAAQPVVDYLYQKNLLQPRYMKKKGGRKQRAELVERLHADIHSSCRRTCAEAHVPGFLEMYPSF